MDTEKLAEIIDRIGNLIEQMYLAHSVRDELHFKDVHKEAGDLCFEATRLLEEVTDG